MAQAKVELSRDLSLFDITMIGVGAMIGAGIFVLTGIAAGTAGPALILSFALNGIITVFTAMVYAELGSAIPEAGGGYLWVKEGLPGPNAFLAGWMSWFAHAVAGSLYALGFGAHLYLVFSEFQVSLGGIPEDIIHKGLAVLVALLFVYINFRGASETGLAGNIVTVLKIIILGLFIVSGLWAIANQPTYMEKFSDFAPEGFGGILSAMGLTFIAFEGYEIIVQAGEEVKNPRHNIPRAVFLSLAIVIPIYMLVAFVAIGAVNPDTDVPTYQWLAEHAEVGVAEAARQFMPLGTFLLLVGGLLSTMSALNATTFSSTRVAFAMGRDRNLPDLFAEVHDRTRTPHKSLLFTGALIIFMAVVIPIEDVAVAADVMFLLLFLQVNIAVLTIRKKFGDRLSYGYLMPFFPIVPIIGIITKLFLALFMFGFSPIAWGFVAAWIGIGTVIYYVYGRPRSEEVERTPIIAQSRLIPQRGNNAKYRVLVPIANPDTLSSLLTPAVYAARRREGSITLLHVITVPEQTPLSAGRAYIEQSKPLTDKALEMLEQEDVPFEVVIRISHHPARAIIDTAHERRANLVIMGWRGASQSPDTVIGRNIDQIIEEVDGAVLTIQQIEAPEYNNVLVPIADPNQIPYALDAAAILTQGNHAKISILHVFPESASQPQRETFMKQLQHEVDEYREENAMFDGFISVEEMTAPDPAQAIVDAATQYDQVIMGATRDGWLKRRFFGSKPSHVARQIETPLVLVRPRPGVFRFGMHQALSYIRGGYGEATPEAEKRLEEHGFLTEERPDDELETAVNTTELLLVGILALIAVVAMYVGSGNLLTWIGALLFFAVLAMFTWVSTQGTTA